MATAEVTFRATVTGTSVGAGSLIGSSGSYRLNSSFSSTDSTGGVNRVRVKAATPAGSEQHFIQNLGLVYFPTSAHSTGVYRLTGSTSDTGIALLARCPATLPMFSTNFRIYTTGSTNLLGYYYSL